MTENMGKGEHFKELEKLHFIPSNTNILFKLEDDSCQEKF